MDGLLRALGGLGLVLFCTVSFLFDREAGPARYGVLTAGWVLILTVASHIVLGDDGGGLADG